MLAATGNHLQILELLLSAGASINRDNASGMIPLHAACLSGNIKAVDILLDHQADFMKKDKVRLLIL